MNNILNATITGKNSYLTWFVWKIKTVAAKVELETEQNKIVKLQTHGLSYFLGKYFFGDCNFQNIFVYQSPFSALELKRTKLLITFSVGNQRGYIILNFIHSMLLSCIE